MCCFGILFPSAGVVLYFVSFPYLGFCVNDGAEGCVYCSYTLLWGYGDFYSTDLAPQLLLFRGFVTYLQRKIFTSCVSWDLQLG